MLTQLNTYETKTHVLYGNADETIFVNKNGLAFVVQSPDLKATGGEPTRVSNFLPENMVALGDGDADDLEIPDWVYEATELTAEQKKQIIRLANETAQMFVEEFGTPLNSAFGDWDATAWQEDRRRLDFKDALNDDADLYNEAWDLYRGQLEKMSKAYVAMSASERELMNALTEEGIDVEQSPKLYAAAQSLKAKGLVEMAKDKSGVIHVVPGGEGIVLFYDVTLDHADRIIETEFAPERGWIYRDDLISALNADGFETTDEEYAVGDDNEIYVNGKNGTRVKIVER